MKIAKSTKKMMSASSFWLDDSMHTYNNDKSKGKDHIAMAGYKRAVANFVKILTGRDIPVQFATKGNSYTDGQTITITGNVSDREFDVVVGLALHEASHVLLSDFNVLRNLQNRFEQMLTSIQRQHLIANMHGDTYLSRFKDIINIIEDRRIDAYVYQNAPGYRLYYKALYDKYFNDIVIDKALLSNAYRTEDWDSYMFRLINIANHNSDVNALKYLKSIFEMVDLQNIGRLRNTDDVLQLAYQIFWIIEMACHVTKDKDNSGSANKISKKQIMPAPSSKQSDVLPTTKSGIEKAIENLLKDDADISDDNINGNESNDADDVSDDDYIMPNNSESTTKPLEDSLTSAQSRQLPSAIDMQRQFIAGTIKKSTISNKDRLTVNALSESGTSIENANFETIASHSVQNIQQRVIVVRKLSKTIIESGTYEDMFYQSNTWNARHINRQLDIVNRGLALGTKLGNKLKIRNEVRDTKYSRLRTGNIDKRLISSLGYGAESIFYRMEQTKFKPMYFHLSIDVSASMSGNRINNCIQLAATIAKAAKMVGNIRVVIDVRGTRSSHGGSLPVVAFIYDSATDTLQDLAYNLSHINCNSTTPEGLCFQVIAREIVNNARNTDAIFFNFSDGEPNFCQSYFGSRYDAIRYTGENAIHHTAQQVKRMQSNGIHIISYLIDDCTDSDSFGTRRLQTFKRMYGKDACRINTNSIPDISKRLNERMLTV
jgi:hypothetical protein